MEWVEHNDPWNFDNNLLLLCKWTKGLSVNNISFSHFPFWIQVWGLPFKSMSEEVGRDLGNKLGKYIKSDKQPWLSEQAKFMRIRVDLPINKPLRRVEIFSIRIEESIGLPLSMKGFPVFVSTVAFLVMMKNVVLGIQVILKLSSSTEIGYKLMEVPKVDLKNLESLVAMALRNEKMKV